MYSITDVVLLNCVFVNSLRYIAITKKQLPFLMSFSVALEFSESIQIKRNQKFRLMQYI